MQVEFDPEKWPRPGGQISARMKCIWALPPPSTIQLINVELAHVIRLAPIRMNCVCCIPCTVNPV